MRAHLPGEGQRSGWPSGPCTLLRLAFARFWGLRLHLVTTVHGLPVAFALTNPKVDERDVLIDLVSLQPHMFHHPDGLVLVVDKGYRDRATEAWLNDADIDVVRPAYRNETPRPGRARSSRPAEHRIGQRHPQGQPTSNNTAAAPHRRGRRVLPRLLSWSPVCTNGTGHRHSLPDRLDHAPWNRSSGSLRVGVARRGSGRALAAAIGVRSPGRRRALAAGGRGA